MSSFTKLFWLALVLVVGAWAIVTPIFEFPDEQAHLGTVAFVATHGRLPDWGEPDLTLEMQQTQDLLGTFRDPRGNNRFTYHPEYHHPYSDQLVGPVEPIIQSLNTPQSRATYVGEEAARYPILYYSYLSLWQRPVVDSDILVRAFFLRLGNLPLVILSLAFAYGIGQLLFRDQFWARLLASMLVLQPAASFVSGGVNSDNLHNTLFIGIIYFGLRLIERGPSVSTFLALTLLPILDIYTKPQGFIALPLVALAVFIYALKHRRYLAIVVLSVLLGLGLFFLRTELSRYLGYALAPNAQGQSLWDYLHFALNKLVAQNIVWFWGVFKWLGVVLPPLYWQVSNRLILVGVLGGLVYAYRAWRRQPLPAAVSPTLFLLLSSLLYAAAIFWFDWQYVKVQGFSLGIQARYFFPTLVAYWALLIIGFRAWHPSSVWSRFVAYLLAGWFLVLQLGGLWRLLTSYYSTSSYTLFVTELSQYKPVWLKGDWWSLYLLLYLAAICIIGVVLYSYPRSRRQ